MKIHTQQHICDLLDAAGVEYELFEHPPVHTVDEAQLHCKHISGAHVKNLCLRNKKKTFYCLVTVPDEKRVDLTALSEMIGHGRLSFVNGDKLFDMLGVKPGSVNPFCLLNDTEKKFVFYMDAELQNAEYINVHPMDNRFTVHLRLVDLLGFLAVHGRGKPRPYDT